jgi:hypothetical protein
MSVQPSFVNMSRLIAAILTSVLVSACVRGLQTTSNQEELRAAFEVPDGPSVPIPLERNTIGPEWTKVTFGPWIRVRPILMYQSVVLELDEPGATTEILKSWGTDSIFLNLPEHQVAQVFAQAELLDGTHQSLYGSTWAWCVGDRVCAIRFTYRAARKDLITGIRVRATAPVKLKKAYWLDTWFANWPPSPTSFPEQACVQHGIDCP